MVSEASFVRNPTFAAALSSNRFTASYSDVDVVTRGGAAALGVLTHGARVPIL